MRRTAKSSGEAGRLWLAGLVVLAVAGMAGAVMARAQGAEEPPVTPAAEEAAPGAESPTSLAGEGPTEAGPTEPGPLAQLAAAGRAALGAAGFEAMEVAAAGRPMTVWRDGEGPALVLLHGAGQQAGSWAAVAPAFTDGFTVHAPDLPGHGGSGPEGDVLPFGAIVEGLEAYLVEQVEGPAVLVGNSMGAWLATLMAHRHPERVARVVLVNGGALLNVPPPGLSLTPVDRQAARRLMAALRDPASPRLPDEVLDDIVRTSGSGPIGRMMRDMPGLVGHLLDGRLGEVTVPVDILWGASDDFMPLAYARRMEAELPRARLTVLEGCGHIPPGECPGRFTEELARLLELPPPEPKPAPEPVSEPVAEPAVETVSEDGR